MSLQCIVFDCDGVILDSVPVKTRAFARIAEPYGQEAQDRFVMYHSLHGGVSRYKKFEWFYTEVLGREITQDESEKLGRLFAEYALDEVRRCPLIPGIKDVLDQQRTDRVAANLRYVAAWNAAFLPAKDLTEAITATFAKRPGEFTGE